MHPFRKYIHTYIELPESDWTEIEACLSRYEYKKGVVLLEEGKICKKLYFLESGFMRFYTYKDGTDVSKFFTAPPYCFTSQRSFANDLPAQENVDTLEDCVIWEMSKEDAFKLLDIKSWNTFVRKLTEEVQYFTEQILEEIQNKTAEERYLTMIEEGNILIQKVPLKHLASYLGIAPQSLSRIRKKYMDDQRKLT